MQDRRAAPPNYTSVASLASQRGLDWFAFFVANLQTGFGPFLSVYLTTQKWTQVDIGLILSIGSIAGLAGQVPGGWLVDWVRSKQRAAKLAVIAIGISAFLIAVSPVFAVILAAKLLHVGASSILGPAIAAITLGLVGHAAIGRRLGRNARFASIGNGVAAAIMGICGYFVSAQAVFLVTAALAIPTALMLSHIREDEVDPVRAGGGNGANDGEHKSDLSQLLLKPALLVLTAGTLLFQFANAAMLPLVAGAMTIRSSAGATALVAACIIVPQLIVAIISPAIGQAAQNWGRRPILLLGFGVLPLRGLLLAATNDPYAIVAVQMLDGVSAAVLGILVPFALADISRGTGRFNLAQGVVGSAGGVGAALSTTIAGFLADRFGVATAFLGLTGVAICGLMLLFLLMPETKPANG